MNQLAASGFAVFSREAGRCMWALWSPEPADHTPAADNDPSLPKPADVALFIEPKD